MTSTATRSAKTGASPILWFMMIAIIGLVLAIGFFSQEEDFEIGGFADPQGTGQEGLLGYRLMIEETGGTALLDVEVPDQNADVAVLATPPFSPLFATEGVEFVESWVPILEWIDAGGTLITSVDVATGPLLSPRLIDEEFVLSGVCTIDELNGIEEIRVLEYSPIEVEANDRICFGTDDDAVVSIRQIGNGQIIRLATIAPLLNRSLDDSDNGALAARITGMENAPTVAFLPEAPVFFIPAENVTRDDIDPSSDRTDNGDQVLRDTQGNPVPYNDEIVPLNDEGNPVGTGTQTLWQLIELRVKVLFVGFVISGVLVALAKGRRLGSPVAEALPIEIPSSSYVDAVGRLYARTPTSRARSAEILRTDLRRDLARRVGMSGDSTVLELATAVTGAGGQDDLVRALEGPAPQTDEEFVALSRDLANIRERVDGGGVATLAQPEEISFGQKG